jgi:aminoglycoside phosphotransferase (APT) family kinase protein
LWQLHTVLADLSDRATLPAPQVENYGLPQDLIAWIASAKQRLAQRQDAEVSAGRAICDRAETLLQEIAQWWERVGQFLPSQLIHGDYGVGNLLFAQGQIAAVVDWDFLACHERLFDLAYALFWMCERLEATNDTRMRVWPRVQELVAHYQATAQQRLTLEERRALPIEMARVPLYWIAEAAWLSDPLTAILQRADQVAFAQWLLSHQPAID